MNVLKDVRALYKEFESSKDDVNRYDFPFPMAVFGTLRSLPTCQGNSHRMYIGGVRPIQHSKAFLPHTRPQSIWLDFSKGDAGPFEVYFFTPDDWQKIIPGVDALESFAKTRKDWGYLRTLMALRILPDKTYPAFETGIGRGRMMDKYLGISEKDFDEYEMIPAWVYSSRECNDLLNSLGERSPVLWDAFA